MTNHELTSPITLRLYATARVERVCEICKGRGKHHHCDAAGCSSIEHNIKTRYFVDCEICHGNGTVTVNVAVDVDVTQYGWQFWLSKPYCESIIDILLDRYATGEAVEGVKEIDNESN